MSELTTEPAVEPVMERFEARFEVWLLSERLSDETSSLVELLESRKALAETVGSETWEFLRSRQTGNRH
jgi:hypothetical protein